MTCSGLFGWHSNIFQRWKTTWKTCQARLWKALKRWLYAKLEKCVFYTFEVEFLGYIASNTRISMDSKKIQVVLDWAMPKMVCDAQCFLSFSNFCWMFIKKYSQIAASLT